MQPTACGSFNPSAAPPAVPFSLAALTTLSRLLPPVRGSGRIALSLRRLCHRKGTLVMPIWPGIRMMVDPSDCLGGLLAFVPQLYDRWERRAITSILRPGDVFVDVGSNIGAYALWAARSVGASGRVLAIEPDEENHRLLVCNVNLNGFEDRIGVLRCGISDERRMLRLHRNVTGNCGGHNFLGVGAEGPAIPCVPLDEALAEAGVQGVRLLKLDIEGFERRVLERYFSRTAGGSRAQYLLVEIEGGPSTVRERQVLRSVIAANGYTVVREGFNTLFRRNEVRE